MNPEIFGMIAAFCTTAAYVPQAIKILRTRHTKDISLGMYVLMTVGVGSWLIFGIMLGSPSMMVANSITLMLSAVILIMKIRYG